MAALVSHAMHRFPTSPPDAVHSSYGLRSESSSRRGGDVSNRSSSGSTGALSRSMRYAEPWLYGSVSTSGGLLLAPALVLCQCSDYVTGSRRSSSKKSPHLCKKCKGTRLPLTSTDSKFGTVRCYPTSQQIASSAPLRAGTVRVTSSSRPSILPTADPYDLMRRSRLSVPETTSTVSPFRDTTKSPTKNSRDNTKPNNSGSKGKSTKQNTSYNSTFGRRSILECDVNPYELMCNESAAKSKEAKVPKHKNVTLVNGQRIRLRSDVDHQDYEDVQVPKNGKLPNKAISQFSVAQLSEDNSSGVRLLSTPAKPDKDSDSAYNTLNSSRFKSILKKRGSNYNGDSSPYSDVEEAVSPTSTRKTGTKFYVPVPMPLTPRKKVQFLDAGFTDGSEEEALDVGKDEPFELIENITESVEPKLKHEETETHTIDKDETTDEVFEDALEEIDTNIEPPTAKKAPEVKRTPKVYRSNSDCINGGQESVEFYDTMALRTRKRSDSRLVFSEHALAKLDGITTRTRKISPLKLRPTRAPPPPPITADQQPKERNNAKTTIEDKLPAEDRKSEDNCTVDQKPDNDSGKKELEKSTVAEAAAQAHKISVNSNVNKPEDVAKEMSPPSAPPRKRSSSKQAGVKIVNLAEAAPSVKIESPKPDKANKTIVQICSPVTDHKIKIKNDYADFANVNGGQIISIFENPQRKTSIMINGDDCYSTVINDNVPLYQSSVVVNDESNPVQVTTKHNSSTIYITGSFSPHPAIGETPKETSFRRASSNDANEMVTSFNTTTEIETLEIGIAKHEDKPTLRLALDSSSSSELLKELLRDPVEAVRHNLVPHVCGKSDVARRQRDNKFPKHILPLGKTESLLESPLEESNLPISLEDSFLRLRNYESVRDEIGLEDGDFSQYEPMDQGSECYTDHSNRSSVTEEELANRTKFYELLAEGDNIEVSESDDHHYESIKVNNDPIYEEIEMPPPLPANPPPSLILDDLNLDKEFTTRSIFEGASKYDILSYLVDAKERGIAQEEGYTYNFHSNGNNEDEAKESYNRASHMSTVSDSSEDNSLIISGALIDEKATFQKPAEVERNDSGVGSETSKSSLSKYRSKPEIFASCEDCDSTLDSKTENDPLLCRKCVKKRSERKEIITEIVETEEKYSRDLQIILEEFYQPMLVAGLLTADQLSAIFLNVEELLENSQALAERLRDAVEIALEQGDDDLLTVNIGKLFLEAAPMLHAFETYCVRQGTASLLLAGLEKEKELLRIFLRVSQMENTMLRRMNLNSFLMVPVQRVTKYPLLLARLFKVTPTHHETREQLKEAQHKIELHLNHMNSETKDVPSKLWRRIGSSSGRRPSTEMDLVNIKLRKIAVDVLDWNHEEARFVLEGKLLFTQPTDNNWRKGRTIKLTPVNALLVINGKTPLNKPSTEKTDENGLMFSMKQSGVREAALLLVRDKNGRYSLLREPLYLDRCVIAADPAWQSYFEVQELLNRDTFIFKAEDEDQTQVWYRKLQYHAQGMGPWRKRRNALANIMINGMGLRS
ncbi:uncharacterized protein LOC109534518 [Dendroctonus ponderosae]|uniref:DH domain-containing protein n=1 Tax=Dendroctonus ponderosae TaxID=77166 RepID=A0AAR5P3W1_DENPD|nr:uncharacterized protein LOC109534518 [Dendroctonus ponderosae]XP_019755803.1 uncharacterized protein LOC109534518 [Dendroctonus ponderosae]KAH1003997.1 hypothetical protein HUJ04_003820 [Dendroctonus ponderosae]KAH1010574.1 hypothetical protein HUJ05_004848 [Dendroctonus ponderosae]